MTLATRLRRKLAFLWQTLPSDRSIVERKYLARVGVRPDLDDPKGFHEKICWLRLNTFNPLHAYCADKITVSAYVAAQIGDPLMVPRYFTTTDVRQLTPANIPASSCVIKPNHASRSVAVVEDAATADWPAIRREMKQALNWNYYWSYREIQYRRMPRAVMVEERLDMTGVGTGEVKMYAMRGRVNFMLAYPPDAVIANRTGLYLDRAFRPIDVGRLGKPRRDYTLARPDDLDRMIEVAEILSRPFAFVRVDFLRSGTGFFVNELTFTPSAGIQAFLPAAFERQAGDQIDHATPLPDWRPILAAAKAMEPSVLPPRL